MVFRDEPAHAAPAVMAELEQLRADLAQAPALLAIVQGLLAQLNEAKAKLQGLA